MVGSGVEPSARNVQRAYVPHTMGHDNKGVSKEEAIRRAPETMRGQEEDPAAAQSALRKQSGQPAQVKPGQVPSSENVPPPGDMGPPEGPAS